MFPFSACHVFCVDPNHCSCLINGTESYFLENYCINKYCLLKKFYKNNTICFQSYYWNVLINNNIQGVIATDRGIAF